MAKKDDGKVDETINKILGDQHEEKPSLELSEAELKALEQEAMEEVLAEEKERLRQSRKDAIKAQLRKKVLFRHGKDEKGDKVEKVFVNLASHALFIRLDNDIYYHGRFYTVSQKKAATIKDMAYRTWLHEHDISGKDMNSFFGRQKLNQVLGPGMPSPDTSAVN